MHKLNTFFSFLNALAFFLKSINHNEKNKYEINISNTVLETEQIYDKTVLFIRKQMYFFLILKEIGKLFFIDERYCKFTSFILSSHCKYVSYLKVVTFAIDMYDWIISRRFHYVAISA